MLLRGLLRHKTKCGMSILKIAIQKSGRLSESSRKLFDEIGRAHV